MPPPHHAVQASFAGGEFSPGLYGRVDIAKYLSGARRLRNVTVLPSGGVRNRAGTKMVAAAGDSTHAVRLIPFVASKTSAYILELGHLYMRFYTLDGQVLSLGVPYQISTPWAAADIFDIKFAQKANIMYFAHPSYAPQQLTFTSSASWALAAYSFLNGPFQLQNTDTTFTLTASALTGSVTLTSTKNLFDTSSPSKHINALFELIWTIVGQTITPSISTSVVNWIPTKNSWQAQTTGTWSGTILIQTSPDNITWTTVSTVTSNGTVSGTASFTDGYLRAIMQSALAFSGTATVVLTGNGDVTTATTLHALNAATKAVPAGDTAKITLTSLTGSGDTVLLQRSDDAGATWNTLATYTTDQAGVTVATTKTACLIRAQKTIDGGGSPVATVDGTTGAAPTLSVAVSTANVSAAIQCGQNWSIITTGAWTGKLRVEISTDGGNNWSLVQTLQSAGSNNFNTSGQTGVSQCLLRVSSDFTVAFSGTASVDLTSSSFDWTGIVKITAVASATSATATVQNLSNKDSTGLANTSATYQWSEGSWSTLRGWPTCVTFFQDRAIWASTTTEPETGWASKIASYADFGISSPLVESDSLSFILPSGQLNAIQSLVIMPNGMLALTSDSEWAVAPGQAGTFTPTSVAINFQGSRGSASIDPVVVGNEAILIQQMGTIVRNLIFQLAVQGFFGDNISVVSQHLFTGYTIKQMAYQQEPDSIIWAVRSDGKLLTLTYLREQEVQAWTWQDSVGTFESVACIPSSANGFNEPWFVYNLGGTRYICRMVNRDGMGTAPEDQFFVDCGLSYSGNPATVISGLSHLNGQAVSVLADGNVVKGQTVSGGQITLATAASKVHVGLPYVSDVETLKIESPDQRGTLQGRRVTIPKLTIRFWNSRGGYFGTVRPGDDGISGLDPIIQRDPTDDYSKAIALKTQDYGPFSPPGGYSKDAHMIFRQVDPLPFTITAFIPQVVAGES